MDRRQGILDAAGRLFVHYGIRKTTVADIAKEAGVGTGSVYLEFDSKEAIACGLASRAHDHMLATLRSVLTEDTTLAERVVNFFTARTQLFRTQCGQGMHALDLLKCGSPWVDFLLEQRALLEVAVGDARLARGIFVAYSAFQPPHPEVDDDDALAAVHALTRRALS